MSQGWNGFVKECNPSIEYLELFALTVAIDLWGHYFENKRVTIFCDNSSVVHMVNKTSSRCVNCMVLIRLIVINCMKFNFRLNVCHVKGVLNSEAGALSRNKVNTFIKLAKDSQIDEHPTMVPQKL